MTMPLPRAALVLTAAALALAAAGCSRADEVTAGGAAGSVTTSATAPATGVSGPTGPGSTAPTTTVTGSTRTTSTTAPRTTSTATRDTKPGREADKQGLQQARTRWESTHPDRYRFTVRTSCFCPRVEHTVTVDGDRITVESRSETEGVPGATEPELEQRGMDWIFDRALAALEGADDVSITYDPTDGHPTEIRVDWIRQAVDDEETIDVSPVTPIP